MKLRNQVFILLVFILQGGCTISFKGTSISPETKTFFVAEFKNSTLNSPASLSQIFTEKLKERIRNESRLVFSDENPDVEFSGQITKYEITAEAPKAGEQTSLNRLTISVLVNYTDSKNEDANWRTTFPYFYEFSADRNFFDIQDEAIDVIIEQLTEDVFNKAFTNW